MKLRYDIDSLNNRDPVLIERLVNLIDRVLCPYFRYQLKGLDRIPDGPALYVGNHNAAMLSSDSFLFGAKLFHGRGLEHMPFGLGHEVAISVPILHQLLVPLGAVRASHENAHRLFERGHKVLVYPGGDLESFRSYRRRNQIVFGGRRGYIRLALRENIPILPLVSAGAHETLIIISEMYWLGDLLRTERWLRLRGWPLAFSLPWGFTLGPPPPHLPLPTRILAEVLEPVRFDRSGADAERDDDYVRDCATLVEGQMQRALDRLVQERSA